ncbi:hypothetical protein F7Q99_36725 [Streptomyces kaniharaensis]|uniref:DUF7739 domain-containing protein n=1 Tax=Streptomyces kaniharaensis TaxID=212423 RepID=A0A6N7L0T2_9ACTN|nr:hypothetical protein [Streptomyces kaniharaensis]MQS17586.1 hypothetical protein [Streptomyces kaniharaensis]
MGIHWGEYTGHRSCRTTQQLATRLRLAGVGDTATIRTFLTALDGDYRDALTFTPSQAEQIKYALHLAVRRMRWFTLPGWRRLAILLANDAEHAAHNGGWTIE